MASPALALVVVPDISDTAAGDVLSIGQGQIHELGTAPAFPANEVVGPDSADQGDRWLVSIINFTQISWTNLIYVADPETTIETCGF